MSSGVDGPLAERVAAVRRRIEDAARRAGRDPATVRLVAVTKQHPVSTVRACLEAGVADIGENRVQELATKASELGAGGPVPCWHFIGQIQRNKVAAAAPIVDLWHGVDRQSVAGEIARRSPGAAVLVQVKLGDEATKGGVAPAGAAELVDQSRALGLDVRGLMGIPPLGVDARPHFARLHDLASRLGLRERSMGMSDDFEAAIGEGSTIVRIGTALVGPRPRVDPPGASQSAE